MDTDSGEFDIVITDQTMPGLTGTELARQLMSVRPDIPIILYSGFAEGIDDAALRQGGIREFFRKPVDTDRLRQTLARLLNR
jgi:CheY-like chemotaxis protein